MHDAFRFVFSPFRSISVDPAVRPRITGQLSRYPSSRNRANKHYRIMRSLINCIAAKSKMFSVKGNGTAMELNG